MAIDAGLKIKLYRKEMGISQKETARRAGITASLLSQIENNRANISLRTLGKIARVFDVPVAWFIADIPVEEDVSIIQPEPEEQERRIFIKQTYNPVVRRGKRSSIFLTQSAIELELLTPRMNQKFVAYRKELTAGQSMELSIFSASAELALYVISGALQVQTLSGAHTLYPGYSICFNEENGLRRISAISEAEPVVFLLVSAPPVYQIRQDEKIRRLCAFV